MSVALTHGLFVLLALGQSLSPERAFNEPVAWGGGANPNAVATPSGLMVSMTDPFVGYVRLISNAGVLGPKVNLGGVSSYSELPLRVTSSGVVVVGESINPSLSWTQLLDLATAQPLTPRQGLDAGVYGPFFLGGGPAWWFLIGRVQAGPLVTRLSADGLPLGASVDLSAFGTLVSVRDTYALFNTRLPDAGAEATVVSIRPDGAESVLASQVAVVTGTAVAVASTSTGAVAIVASYPVTDAVFLDPLGAEVGRARIETPNSGFVDGTLHEVAPGEVWFAGTEGMGAYSASSLALTRLSSDGGSVRSELIGLDAGVELYSHGLIVSGGEARVLYARKYSELAYGNWQSTLVMPVSLESNGAASANGATATVFPWPSAQRYPAFASRQPGRPSAVGWNDDQQLPREWQLVAMRLDSAGVPAGPPTQLEKLRHDFTGANISGRFMATTGSSFMAVAYNGFFERPIEWSFDGGVFERSDLTGFGIHSTPLVTPVGSGYGVTFSDYRTWHTRLLDSAGNALPTDVGQPGEVIDVWDELHLIRRNDTVSVTRVFDAGIGPEQVVVREDAGVVLARFAFSGSSMLVAWQTMRDAGVGRVSSQLFALEADGGASTVDAEPTSFDLASVQFARILNDIGLRNGVFYVLGVESVDGGERAWLYRRPADGGVMDQSPVDLGLGFVNGLTAGPQVDDGSLLVAYTRPIDDWPALHRGYFRAIGDTIDAGPGQSGDGGPVVRTTGPLVYQVCGCGSSVLVPLPLLGALLAMALRRRSRGILGR